VGAESFLLLFLTTRPHIDHANNQNPKYGWYKGSNLEGLKMSDFPDLARFSGETRFKTSKYNLQSLCVHSSQSRVVLSRVSSELFFAFSEFSFVRCLTARFLSLYRIRNKGTQCSYTGQSSLVLLMCLLIDTLPVSGTARLCDSGKTVL